MCVNYNLVAYLLTVIICVNSQSYNPYSQYQYQQPYPYPPVYNPGYIPYPYAIQPYQPYVSPPPSPYNPYYNPTPSYQIPSAYVSQTYQTRPIYNTGYYPQNYYPHNPANNIYAPQTSYPSYPTPVNSTILTGPDPYANITTNIIDIEPKYFHYYKKFFNLEDGLSPVEVIDTDYERAASNQPPYIVKTESKQSNYSSVPHSFTTHDVQTKTYSFKKTFTVDPNKKENSVINLSFVNGVQITTVPPEVAVNDATYPSAPQAEESLITTTETDEPEHLVSWLL